MTYGTRHLKTLFTMFAVGCMTVAMSASQAPAAHKPMASGHSMPARAKATAAMDAKCQAMVAEHETMASDTKAADQRLDALVATMNAASGAEKGTATAAVVTEMATGGRAMRVRMAAMDQEMMAHMMEHMQAGKDSMANCPMMKSMGAATE